MAGRLLLVFRLMVRDLLRHRTETVLLLVTMSAATTTMTLGLALIAIAADPYQRTRAATAGPDLVMEPGITGPDALAALAPLATAPCVTGHTGPYPLAFLKATTRGTTVRVVVEGRDGTPAAVDQPAVTDGTWVRPGGVVVERTFAGAVGLHIGDTVSVEGRQLRVAGIAVTAARSAYPWVGWHLPGTVQHQDGGLLWVDRGDIGTLAGDQLSYTLNLKLADPQGGDAFLHQPAFHSLFRGWNNRAWQEIADTDGRLTSAAQETLVVGSWLLTVLSVAGVAGIVAGRVIGQRADRAAPGWAR